MVEQRNWSEATADLPGGFVPAKACPARTAECADAPATEPPAPGSAHAAGRPELVIVAGTDVADASAPDARVDYDRDLMLARDVIDIAEARDALLATPSRPPLQDASSPAVGLLRTPDSVPIILGTVLGFLMCLVFATAALFANLAR